MMWDDTLKQMVIAIDFDGTIVEHAYPDIGLAVPGALNWIKAFQDHGAKIILWTMRSGETLDEAVAFLNHRGIELWAANHNPDQGSWTDSAKAYAHVYIDDAAFGCPLRESVGVKRPSVDWSKVGPSVLKRIVEQQQVTA